MKHVPVKITGPGQRPVYATPGSSGADIFAFSVTRDVDTRTLIYDSGISVACGDQYDLQIRARSSLARTQWYIPHGLGTIDSDYTGTIKLIFAPRTENISFHDMKLPYQIGEAFAQLIIGPVHRMDLQEVSELVATERGTGGFGSTTEKTKVKLKLGGKS